MWCDYFDSEFIRGNFVTDRDSNIEGEQDSLVVKAPDFGSKGPRFDPTQQPFVQLS